MKATKLAELSFEELNRLRESIQNDPANRNTDGSFWLYTPKARAKLDVIRWAVTYKLQAKRCTCAGGNAPPCLPCQQRADAEREAAAEQARVRLVEKKSDRESH